MNEELNLKICKWITIEDLLEKYSLTRRQINHFISNKHKNGLSKCITKLGRRNLFSEDLFHEWFFTKKPPSKLGRPMIENKN